MIFINFSGTKIFLSLALLGIVAANPLSTRQDNSRKKLVKRGNYLM